MAARSFRFDDLGYPSRLRSLASLAPAAPPPETVSVEGDFVYDDSKTHIAIVGSRGCPPLAYEFAFEFARQSARAGAIVISGGAVGIDRAAHEGAMEGGGATWSVLGCGAPHIHPQENADLFPRIVESGGAIIQPFPDGAPPLTARFLSRNRTLVALADVVIVVQAGMPSGALSSAQWALKLGRPLWVVPGALAHKGIAGSAKLMANPRVHVVRSMFLLGEELGVPVPDPDADPEAASDVVSRPVSASTPVCYTEEEKKVLQALSFTPKHPDQLSLETGLSASAVSTVLLTLALGDVVVEGSSGLFQRKKLVTC